MFLAIILPTCGAQVRLRVEGCRVKMENHMETKWKMTSEV